MEEVAKNKERRNVYMNLAWTSPVANTGLNDKILYDKVANMALDMFCDTRPNPPCDGTQRGQ